MRVTLRVDFENVDKANQLRLNLIERSQGGMYLRIRKIIGIIVRTRTLSPAKTSTKRKEINCFACGKKGHYAKELSQKGQQYQGSI